MRHHHSPGQNAGASLRPRAASDANDGAEAPFVIHVRHGAPGTAPQRYVIEDCYVNTDRLLPVADMAMETPIVAAIVEAAAVNRKQLYIFASLVQSP